MIGQQVAHYRILDSLGSGGMGEVYRAEDVRLGRQVALKFLKPEYLNEAKARQRFEFEARAAAILNHPHITTLFEFNADLGFISLEYVDGGTLEDVLGDRPLEPAEAIRYGLAICRGLGHAHGRNVIHRDIKPGNVLIGKDGAIKLTDFGLAKVRDLTAQATQDVVQGTPAYMAPEQISGQGSDRRGDLFALGVVLYRALAGRLPWQGEGVVAILFSVLQQEPDSLTDVAPRTPERLARLVEHLMVKEPDERLSSAEDVEAQLLEIEAALKGGVAAPAARTAPAEPAPTAVGEAEAARREKPWETTTAFAAIAETPGLKFPLIGRDQEFAILTGALETALAGSGRTLLVGGEAGIGKSRLVQELEAHARARKVLFLKGDSTLNGGRNFEPFVEALESFARGADLWGARYLAELTTEHESLGALLPTLKVLLDPGPAGAAAPRSREQLWYILDAMLKSIAADVPFVLHLGELHHADEGTLALLTHVTRNLGGSRLLIVGTYRSEELLDVSGREMPLADLIRTLSTTGNFQNLELQPLPEATSIRFLEAAFPETPWTPALARFIHSRAQGNPFFTTEILNLMAGARQADKPLAQWETGDAAQALPRTITDVVKRRLMRLSQEERDVLEVAAVEGETFHTDVVGEATGLPRLQLLKRLRSLHVTHHLIEPTSEGHRFTQGLIRDVMLREIPEDLKVEYHSVIGSHLTGGYADRADYAGSIGYHLFRGQRFAEALPYLMRAAAEARRLFLNDRALDYYEDALHCLEKAGEGPVTRSELLRGKSEVLLLLGRLEEARATAETALEEARNLKAERDSAASLALIGQAALAQGDHGRAEQTLIAAFESYSGLGDRLQVARTEERLGSLAALRGEYDAALLRLAAARDVMDAEGDEAGAAPVALEVGRIEARRGNYDRALEHYEDAIERLKRLGDRYGVARGLLLKGSALFHFHRYETERAVACYEEGLEIATAIGDLQGMAFFQANLGNVHLVRRDNEAALKAYSGALARFREIGDLRGTSQSLVALGNVCYMRGQFGEAAGYYRKSLEARHAMGDRWGLANSLDNLGVAEYYLGQWSAALEHAREALRLRIELGEKPGQAESALNLGNLLAVLGNRQAALEQYDTALRVACELEDQPRIARARLSQACVHLWNRDMTRVRELLDEVRRLKLDEPALRSRLLLLDALSRESGGPDSRGPVGGGDGAPEATLREAVAEADRSGSVVERAAARLALGRHHRMTGTAADARSEVDQALLLLGQDRVPLLELEALRNRREMDVSVGFGTGDDENRIHLLEERLSAAVPVGTELIAPGSWVVFPLP